MSLESKLKSELKSQGADFISFADISALSNKQNRDYPNAILIGIVLSKDYLKKVTNTPNYVKEMVRDNQIQNDEFYQKERMVDKLADSIAFYLISRGYSALSQSEESNCSVGRFDEKTKCSQLPHKTIAGLAGLGWIGKHNLLVTQNFGSAICMCTVLTDAPLKTILYAPETSRCGDCSICQDICPVKAIKGNLWSINTSRDELVNVYKCITCLKCLVFCPWTQTYMNKSEKGK